MPNNMNMNDRRQNAANGRRSFSGGPDRNRRALPAEAGPGPSPLAALARKIRSEQGAAGLSEFIAAMAPFAAPNELRALAEELGVEYEPFVRQPEPAQEQYSQPRSAGGGPDIMRMMQLMQLMNGMKGGGRQGMDPMQLFALLGGMQGGGPDLSQLSKMMGG